MAIQTGSTVHVSQPMDNGVREANRQSLLLKLDPEDAPNRPIKRRHVAMARRISFEVIGGHPVRGIMQHVNRWLPRVCHRRRAPAPSIAEPCESLILR
jgi:hypothetical protein